MTGHQVNLRRLRFRDPRTRRLPARLRMETALAAGANASRLNKDAVLCVRRMATRFSRLDQFAADFDAEILNAARPARDAVPANANAVLFADRAELLACLARDWCSGNLGASWWWPVLHPRTDIAEIARRAWLEDGQCLPAALDRLAAVNLAERFLRKLGPETVAQLWRNIIETFQLGDLDEVLRGEAEPQTDDAGWVSRAPPWTPRLNFDSALSADIARVLVTAVLLERAPVTVRSASFARDLQQWIQRTKNDRGSQRVPSSTPFVTAPAASDEQDSDARLLSKRTAEAAVWPPEEAAQRGLEPVASGAEEDRSGSTESPRKSGHRARENVAAQNAAPARPNRQIRIEPLEDATESGDNISVRSALNEPSGPRELSSAHKVPAPEKMAPAGVAPVEAIVLPVPKLERITTEWGGILYLINVAIAQGLYADFTAPFQTGLALPLWDFLALVGEEFAGETFRADPLPRLFARLSGRAEEEPAGAEFEPPSGEPLREWLGEIGRDIGKLLRRALALAEGDDVVSLILNRSAKIVASSSRLDTYFSLGEHPIELRIAGLDRDPGWIPAAGRAVHFHYD